MKKPCEECGQMFEFNPEYKKIPKFCNSYCKEKAKGKEKAAKWAARMPRKTDPRASERFARTAIGRPLSAFEKRYSTLRGCFN